MRYLSVILVVCFAQTIYAQGIELEKKSKLFLEVEGRYNEPIYANPKESFRGADLTVSLKRTNQLGKRLFLNYGLGLGFSSYTNTISQDGVLFVSYFRNQETHYFSLEKVKQLNVNIPLLLSFNLMEGKSGRLNLEAGMNTQFNVLSRFEGQGLEIEESRFINQFAKTDSRDRLHYSILNNLSLRTGLNFYIPVAEHRLKFGFGAEYNVFGRTFGSYGSLAYQFDF
jgi:hypothetical protein